MENQVTTTFKDYDDYCKNVGSFLTKELEKINPPANIDFQTVENKSFDSEINCFIFSKKFIVSFNGYSYNIGEKIIIQYNENTIYKVVTEKDVLSSRVKTETLLNK